MASHYSIKDRPSQLKNGNSSGLDGMLPATQKTMAEQVKRIRNMLDARPEPLGKYLELAAPSG